MNTGKSHYLIKYFMATNIKAGVCTRDFKFNRFVVKKINDNVDDRLKTNSGQRWY